MSQQQQQQANEEEELDDTKATFDKDHYANIYTWWCDNAYEIQFQQEFRREPLSIETNQCNFAPTFYKQKDSKLYQQFLDQLRNSTFPIVRITLAGHEGASGRICNTAISEEIIQDICNNLPKTCVAVVFENTSCRLHPDNKYHIPKKITYDENGTQIVHDLVNLDEAVSKAVQNSNVKRLILGQVNEHNAFRYEVEHLRLLCRERETEPFAQQKEKNVEDVLNKRQSAAGKAQQLGEYTAKVPNQQEINLERYWKWLGPLIPQHNKDTDKDNEDDDDYITEQQFQDLTLSQQQYEEIITKVIAGTFTSTDAIINGRECNIFDLIHALENYKKNDNSRPAICRYGCFAKAFSFGENNARLRRINQLAKILQGVYTKNMNLEEKHNAKQKWKTNESDKHDQLITWLDLENISKNTKARTIHNNH